MPRRMGVRAGVCGALAALAGGMGMPLACAAAGTGQLPDTGITQEQCYRLGTHTLVSCVRKSAVALNGSQDGMTGTDVVKPNGRNGKLGFNYTKIAADGSKLPAEAIEWACVKDNITGLLWEIKTADGGWRDLSRRYTLHGDGRSGDASAYVAAVNAASLCGKTGWRLPTRHELQSLVDYGVSGKTGRPMMDEVFFPNTSPHGYWTASPLAGDSGSAWYVYLGTGAVINTDVGYENHVRLVRPVGAQAQSRYMPSADGTEVTDARTGLTWQRCSAGQTWSGDTCAGVATRHTHEEALLHAQARPGWRLPTVKDLASLVDESRRHPAIDTMAFPATPAYAYWASSPRVGTPSTAWHVEFNDGNVRYNARSSYRYHVRLVKQPEAGD